MSIPRPVFCAGDVVDCVKRDGTIVREEEVLSIRYGIIVNSLTGEPYKAWHYKTNFNRQMRDRWWAEDQLRKRPHNYWQDSVWKPEEVTA